MREFRQAGAVLVGVRCHMLFDGRLFSMCWRPHPPIGQLNLAATAELFRLRRELIAAVVAAHPGRRRELTMKIFEQSRPFFRQHNGMFVNGSRVQHKDICHA